MLLCDEYLTPTSLDEAFDPIEAHRGRYRLVAGATDTLPWAREGRAGDVHIPVLIDIARIPELRERTVDDKRVRLGAATPIQRFLDDAGARPRDAVHAALRGLVRRRPDCASPPPSAAISSMPRRPPTARRRLIAHDAVVELARRATARSRRRRMPIDEFITGPARPRSPKTKSSSAIECEALPGYGGSFEKVGHRRSLVISTGLPRRAGEARCRRPRFEDVRLAIGGIGPVPDRLREVEAVPAWPAAQRRAARTGRRHAGRASCARARGRITAATWCAASCCAA